MFKSVKIKKVNGYKLITIKFKNVIFEIANLKGTNAWVVFRFDSEGNFLDSHRLKDFKFKYFLSNIIV